MTPGANERSEATEGIREITGGDEDGPLTYRRAHQMVWALEAGGQHGIAYGTTALRKRLQIGDHPFGKLSSVLDVL